MVEGAPSFSDSIKKMKEQFLVEKVFEEGQHALFPGLTPENVVNVIEMLCMKAISFMKDSEIRPLKNCRISSIQDKESFYTCRLLFQNEKAIQGTFQYPNYPVANSFLLVDFSPDQESLS